MKISGELLNVTERDSIARLEQERINLVEDGRLEEERLILKRKSLKEGTLAYQEALQEELTFIEQRNLEITQKESEIQVQTEARKFEEQQRLVDNELLSFQTRLNALDEYNRLVTESDALGEYDRTKLLEDSTRRRIALARAEKDAKLATFDAISQAGNAMSQAVGEQTALGKSLAVASALISTYKGIANEIGTQTVTPWEIALKIANIATVAAIGFKSVKDILAVDVPNSGGGGAGGSAPQAQPPAFNIVGQSSTNQLAESINNQEQQPIKAYVVAKDVTTQQNLDMNIRSSVSFG